MGEAILRIVSSFQRPCEICHKPFKELYRIELDGYGVLVCSPSHAQIAKDRWMEKKESNIVPTEEKSTEENMMEGDSIPEGDDK